MSSLDQHDTDQESNAQESQRESFQISSSLQKGDIPRPPTCCLTILVILSTFLNLILSGFFIFIVYGTLTPSIALIAVSIIQAILRTCINVFGYYTICAKRLQSPVKTISIFCHSLLSITFTCDIILLLYLNWMLALFVDHPYTKNAQWVIIALIIFLNFLILIDIISIIYTFLYFLFYLNIHTSLCPVRVTFYYFQSLFPKKHL